MSTARKVTPRPYHHGNLREALVAAGVRLARTGGPQAVVLRAVSRETGVSHNAAYRHFTDHDELLVAVAEQCMDRLAELMTQRTDAVTSRGRKRRAQARLAAIGRAYIEFAVAEPGWFRTAFAGFSDAPVADPDSPSGPYDLLALRLDELVDAGVLPPERRPGAELAAWSMVHGLATLLVDGPLRTAAAQDAERAISVVLAVVQRGL